MISTGKKYSELEAALRRDPSVLDCAVRAWDSENGGSGIIAYVVPAPTFSEVAAQASLLSTFPGSPLPDRYALISGLPFSNDGTLDEEALARLTIVDEQLAKVWEQKLKDLEGVKQALVLVARRRRPPKALHVSDLLPGEAGFAALKKKETISLPSHASAGCPSSGKKPAISVGDPLRNQEEIPRTLQEALKRAAEGQPVRDITYLQADGSEIVSSYQELREDAEHILAGLRSLGLQPGDKVIFQLDRNQDFIPAFWGCVLGGLIPAPISIAPSYQEVNSTINKLRHSWEMLEKPVILAGRGLSEEVRNVGELLHLQNFRVETVEKLRAARPDHRWHQSQPHEVCLMLLTSGSTGSPKGVMQSHKSLLYRSAGTAQLNHFGQSDVSINWFPLDHVGGIVMFHLMDLFSGARQIHVPTEVILQEPLRWLDLIERHRATITWAPNFAFGLINDREEQLQLRRWDLSSMRFILNGGEAIVPKTARRFLHLLRKHGLRADAMHPAWGMSETCSGVAFSDRCSLDTMRDEDAFVEVGMPIPGLSFRIVDGSDQVFEEEQIGRLQLSGPPVTSGYYKNPELNREGFSKDGWFNTGDLGFLRDGRLTITGRAKDVIIVNGVNFYSHEIEAVVEDVEGVKVSFTAACPVRMGDQNTDQLAIFFHTPRTDWPSRLQVMKTIRETLLRKMGLNPQFLIPLSQEEIPKTAIGKIQRSKLRDRFEAGEFGQLLKRVDIESASTNTVPDWFYRESWARRERATEGAAPRRGTFLVFADESGLADLLCEELMARGSRCVRVKAGQSFARLAPDQYRLDPRSAADYRELVGGLAAERMPFDHVLHLWSYGCGERECTGQSALRESLDHGTYSVLLFIQGMVHAQADKNPVRLFVFTAGAQITSSEEKKVRPELSAVSGLLLTAGLELPWLKCRYVDLEFDVPEANVQHVLRELEISKGNVKVAYRGGRRLEALVSRIEMIEEPPDPLPIKAGGLYMITGGLGGLGTELSKYLISRHEAKLMLVGRTPLSRRGDDPDGSAWSKRSSNYSAIQKLGANVRYEALDIADVDRVRECIADAEARWSQPLAGIFHLAGSLTGSENLAQHWERAHAHLVAAETIENFEGIFHSKVYGTWALFEAIQGRADALFVAFSSVNALFGGASFSAYSAANAFLDSFCLRQRYRSHPQTFCFNWSMWNDLGMAEACPEYARELAQNMGFRIIGKEQGIHSMLAGLCRHHPQLAVGLDGDSPQLRGRVDRAIYPLAEMSAFYVATGDASVSEGLEHLAKEDPLGEACRFVAIPEMPLTEDGQIDREKLPDMAQEPAGREERTAPLRSAIEQRVAQLWREELNLSEIPGNASFFELGGDSLTAVRLVNRLRETFGASVSIRTFFEMPTIPQQALVLANKLQQQAQPEASLAEPHRSGRAQQLLNNIDQIADAQVDALLEELAGNEFPK